MIKEEVRLGVGLCNHLGHQEEHLVIICLPLPPVSAFVGLLYESLTCRDMEPSHRPAQAEGIMLAW